MNAQLYDKQRFRQTLEALLDGKNIVHPEVIEAVERWMDSDYRGLVLMGSVGTGKTTMAYAIRRAWEHPLKIANVRNCQWIADQIKLDATWVQEIAGEKGLMILDDFGTEPKVWGEESMLPILFTRYQNNLPTIITTNLNFQLIKERYGERIADRLRDYARIVMDYDSLRGNDTDNH